MKKGGYFPTDFVLEKFIELELNESVDNSEIDSELPENKKEKFKEDYRALLLKILSKDHLLEIWSKELNIEKENFPKKVKAEEILILWNAHIKFFESLILSLWRRESKKLLNKEPDVSLDKINLTLRDFKLGILEADFKYGKSNRANEFNEFFSKLLKADFNYHKRRLVINKSSSKRDDAFKTDEGIDKPNDNIKTNISYKIKPNMKYTPEMFEFTKSEIQRGIAEYRAFMNTLKKFDFDEEKYDSYRKSFKKYLSNN